LPPHLRGTVGDLARAGRGGLGRSPSSTVNCWPADPRQYGHTQSKTPAGLDLAGRASRGGPWSPAAGRGGARFGTERGRHREHLAGGGQEPRFGAIRGREGVTAMQSDYYLVLGVSRDETSRGIRDAYRQLAKRHHPDLAGPEQAEAFRELVEAYEVLSDAEKRRRYKRGPRAA